MIVEATAPSRIDLAGGTLDIYPLYLFEDGGITVNIGIDIGSWARITTRDDARVVLRSLDTGATQEADTVDGLEFGGPLDLVARIVRFYRPSTGVEVETRNQAPKGSGLGASSSLLIALSGALNELNHSGYSAEELISFGANLEAQSIRIPTGKQDYYAAMYGGVNALWFEVKENRVEPLLIHEDAISTLESRLILSFTGISHFSGATNWGMMRNYIDGSGHTREHLKQIKQTALDMRDVLRAGDFDAFARVIDREWQNRRSLAEGVSTPEIDRMIAAAADAGAMASKICGAGGGGCMITFVREGTQEAVIQALESNGARHLPFRISRHGLQVKHVA